MKKLLLLIFVATLSATSFAQTNTKTEKIRKLLEVTGSSKLGMQVLDNIVDMYKRSYAQVDHTFWDEFRKEINAGELVNLVIPIYDKFYTEQELTQLITFYESPLGKKVVQTLPGIMQESMRAGEEWGKQIGEKVVKRLIAEGYTKEG